MARSGPERSQDVDAFLEQVAAAPKPGAAGGEEGRLTFIMDATMSRQPTWDAACAIQADMFYAAAEVSSLAVQLVFFRGQSDCRFSPWIKNPQVLARKMSGVRCRGGLTQIERALAHAARGAAAEETNAVVYVGDAMEENADAICARAAELGLAGAPVFVFQEGSDPIARDVFQEVARLSGGAYHRFDLASADTLRRLLRAVAVYAAGGRQALLDYGRREGGDALRIARQLK
ncbi:MAG: VWA domain-containing protein [Pseudomonadota bacterium]